MSIDLCAAVAFWAAKRGAPARCSRRPAVCRSRTARSDRRSTAASEQQLRLCVQQMLLACQALVTLKRSRIVIIALQYQVRSSNIQ